MSGAGEDIDEDEDFDDGEEGTAAELPEDEDGKVQRKLHLFQCSSVQQSIRRLWDLLPKDNEGRLVMEGYVELNLRLQKCLCQEFVLERAVDSAIGDWGEDVREGQRAMVADEFAMFLFELCSLWCGPSISLLVYLFFLNAVFIAVSDARGAHTIGLRPLAAVERLPQSFFDLLSVQGWAKQPEENAGVTSEQALSAWLVRNLSPESEQSALLQVQRQVFQVTHDVRSVLPLQDRGDREADILELVKQASKNLSKITPIEAAKLGDGAASAVAMLGQGTAGASPGPSAELFPRPWCPSTHGKPPPAGPRPPAPLSPPRRQSAPRSAPGARSPRSRSQPQGQQTLAALTDVPRQQQARVRETEASRPPRGRAFDTQRARPAGRGLMLAGNVVMAPGAARGAASASQDLATAASASSERERSASMRESPTTSVLQSSRDGEVSEFMGASMSLLPEAAPMPGMDPSAGPISSPPQAASPRSGIGSRGKAASQVAKRLSSVSHQADSSATASQTVALSTAAAASAAAKEVDEIVPLHGAVMDTPFAPPYKLPRNPGELYQKQTDPMLRMRPSSVVYTANKFSDSSPLVKEPFERVLRKLPENVRPGTEGPVGGPLSHPNEPVWFEMVHRLQGILKRQGRRAERRRKRRLRSKLFRGRSKTAGRKRDEGRELREYFDRHAASQREPQGGSAPPGISRAAGGQSEFLEKVHERYLVHRDRVESKPFRIHGLGGSAVGRRGVGELPERPCHVVRPVYMPPPSSMPSSP